MFNKRCKTRWARLLLIVAALVLPLAWSATASAESGCHRNGGNGNPTTDTNSGR